MAIIEAHNLTKTFVVTEREKGMLGAVRALLHPTRRSVEALDGVSLEIEEGEIVGYIGPNGAGKSTTVKLCMGILTPSAGWVRVDGLEPSRDRKQVARRSGVVFGQRSRLWWDLPVYDSLEYVRAVYSIPRQQFERNLEYFTDRLALGNVMNKPVRVLSLGERMRVELTAAMLHDPKVLYLDEPTVGLDVVGKHQLHEIIHTLNEERRMTILLVTHDVLDIERLCQRVLIIDRGRIIWTGSLDELRLAKGETRLVTVEYAEQTSVLMVDGLTLVNEEDRRHVYSLDPSVADLGPILQSLSAAGRLQDVSIAAPSIESVIRRIYGEDDAT